MDKLRNTTPLVITMEDGEAPSSSKLNAVSNQLRTSTSVLEKAIGDLWNQSGDSTMVSYPLQIPSLARFIGPMKYTNPCLFPVDEDFIYVDNVGVKYTNQNEFYLQFAPKTVSSISVNDSGGSALVTRKDTKGEVDASGDYWVSSNGRVVSFDIISSTAEVQYTVDSSAWNIRDYTLPAVIPDPRQSDFTGCRITRSGDGNTYYINLPPRLPLSTDFDGGAFDGWSFPDRYPSSDDLSDNYDTSIAAVGSKKLWQDPSVSALDDSYYRYTLPKEIRDSLASINVGDALPQGFLYIWDQSSGTIIADCVFRKTSSDFVFQIESSYVDFSGKVSASEAEASYNNTGYTVIAVGSPISRSFWTLSNAFMNHTHGNEGDFSSLTTHSNLLDLNPPPSDYSGHSSTYPTDVPAWAPSRWYADDHVSLLSRAGSQGTAGGRNRDVNDNAMLGDLILASTSASGGDFLNISADSNRLYFGSISDGVCLYYDSNLGRIRSGGTTIYGNSTTSYGLIAEGDTTSPTYSSFRIVPQNSAPSSPSEGDVYVDGQTHHFYGYNGSSWVQLD